MGLDRCWLCTKRSRPQLQVFAASRLFVHLEQESLGVCQSSFFIYANCLPPCASFLFCQPTRHELAKRAEAAAERRALHTLHTSTKHRSFSNRAKRFAFFWRVKVFKFGRYTSILMSMRPHQPMHITTLSMNGTFKFSMRPP